MVARHGLKDALELATSVVRRRWSKRSPVAIVAQVDANQPVLWPIREVEAGGAGVLLRIAVEIGLVDVVDRVHPVVDRLEEGNPVRVVGVEVVALRSDTGVVVSGQRVERGV